MDEDLSMGTPDLGHPSTRVHGYDYKIAKSR
jgi:hypothetical protein